MTPHHLHATAAAWSLAAARTRLTQLAEEEAAQIAAEQLEAPALLRSPVWGSRCALGGHSDPTAGLLAVADRTERRNRWAEMNQRAEQRITGIAAMLRIHGVRDPLACILAALPNTLPGTAALVARHLQDEDRWIRDAIALPADRRRIPGLPCPACEDRAMDVQVAGPEDAWTVVCGSGCLCIGRPDTRLPDAERDPGCPCGMEQRVEGVAHIWPRAAVLAAVEPGAVAGAAPTTEAG